MKDFTRQIQQLRDDIHREIIKEVILRTSNEYEGYELELNQPFYTWVNDWDQNYKVQIVITGIGGTTHELLCRCITDGEVSENVDYQDLEFAELDYLYRQIVSNSFTIKVY
jgi:hypothetical protein